jgi:hypothetical protein
MVRSVKGAGACWLLFFPRARSPASLDGLIGWPGVLLRDASPRLLPHGRDMVLDLPPELTSTGATLSRAVTAVRPLEYLTQLWLPCPSSLLSPSTFSVLFTAHSDHGSPLSPAVDTQSRPHGTAGPMKAPSTPQRFVYLPFGHRQQPSVSETWLSTPSSPRRSCQYLLASR